MTSAGSTSSIRLVRCERRSRSLRGDAATSSSHSLVSVRAPMGSDRAKSGVSASPAAISTVPPPTSMTTRGPADHPNHRRAARNDSRASSGPDSTPSPTPDRVATCSMTSAPFAASRMTEVANGTSVVTSARSASRLAWRTADTSSSTPALVIRPRSSSARSIRRRTLCETSGCSREPRARSTTTS